MKRCTTCGLGEDKVHFNKKGSKSQYKCSGCASEYSKIHYQANKQQYYDRNKKQSAKISDFVRDLKTKPCMDCGGTFHHSAMDFDHVRGEKSRCIADITHIYGSMKSVLLEIKKCDLVCANCHRVRTFNRKRE